MPLVPTKPSPTATQRDLEVHGALAEIKELYAALPCTLENLRAAVEDIVHAFAGIHEVGETNTGYWVDIFHRALGLEPGMSWCLMFVQYVLWVASGIWSKPDILPKNVAGTQACWRWAVAEDLVVLLRVDVQPWDVMIYTNGSTDHGHTDFAVEVGPQMRSFGGNTSSAHSGNGGEVAEVSWSEMRYGTWGKKRPNARWVRGAISLEKLYNKYWLAD